ncbi:MAG TPA: 3-dehydroquinate synthase [Flavobacteriales bacterium]|nr:3-dehydroquinate synthase [Flavobacteriales bacterium]
MKVSSSKHDVIFGSIASGDLMGYLKKMPQVDKVFVLTDTNTSKFCLHKFISGNEQYANFHVLEFEYGEENKTIDTCKSIWQTLLEMGATRNSVLINLGGGVVTDLGGFVAGTFKRGIPYFNIPTTLLAQADASVGGKTAVDLDAFKNQVGLFYEPMAVFVDIDFLDTLSKREWLNGYAEMIKHAILESAEAWNELTNATITNKAAIQQLLYRSVQFKSKIVTADANEKGLRKILNFGHTVGHAIETFFLETDKPHLKHGEAIVAGMIVELFISETKLGFNPETTQKIIGFLNEFYSKVKLEKGDFIRLIEIMKTDKKNRGSEYNFTLMRDIGNPEFDQPVLPQDIDVALNRYRML